MCKYRGGPLVGRSTRSLIPVCCYSPLPIQQTTEAPPAERSGASGGRTRTPTGGRGGAGGRGSGGERGRGSAREKSDKSEKTDKSDKSDKPEKTANPAVAPASQVPSSPSANELEVAAPSVGAPKGAWGKPAPAVKTVTPVPVPEQPVVLDIVQISQNVAVPNTKLAAPTTSVPWGSKGTSFADVVRKANQPPPIIEASPPAPVEMPQAETAAGSTGDRKKGKKGERAPKGAKKVDDSPVPAVTEDNSTSTIIEARTLASIEAEAKAAARAAAEAAAAATAAAASSPVLAQAPLSPPRGPSNADSNTPQKLVKMGKWAAPTEDQTEEIKFGNFGGDSGTSSFAWAGLGTNDSSSSGATSEVISGGNVWSSNSLEQSKSSDASSGSAGRTGAPPGLENKSQRAPGQSRGNKNDGGQLQNQQQMHQAYQQPYQQQPPGISSNGRGNNSSTPQMTIPYGYPGTGGFDQQQYYGSNPATVGQNSATGGAGAGPGGANGTPAGQPQQPQQPQQQQQQQQQQFNQFYNPYFYQQPYYHYTQQQPPFYGNQRGGMYQNAPRGQYPQDQQYGTGGMYSADGMYSGGQFADASGYGGMPMQPVGPPGQGAGAKKGGPNNNGAQPQQGLSHGGSEHSQGQAYPQYNAAYPSWPTYPQSGGWGGMPFPAMTPGGNVSGQPNQGFPGQQGQGGRDGNQRGNHGSYNNRNTPTGGQSGANWA